MSVTIRLGSFGPHQCCSVGLSKLDHILNFMLISFSNRSAPCTLWTRLLCLLYLIITSLPTNIVTALLHNYNMSMLELQVAIWIGLSTYTTDNLDRSSVVQALIMPIYIYLHLRYKLC